jgi:hypothetical protein
MVPASTMVERALLAMAENGAAGRSGLPRT